MGSSTQATSHENLETASAIRTETITGSHLFTIYGYSLVKGIGIGKSIKSDIFTVGGYNWIIVFYPDGKTNDDKEYISILLQLKSEATDVKAQTTFTILQQNGAPSNLSRTIAPVQTFKSSNDTSYSAWGYSQFAKKTEFEASKHLKEDTVTVKCIVSVLKGTKLEVTNPYGIIVPPSNLNQHLANLLESGNGADVTFVVKGERFKAHRWMLAARSAVFNAELFGCMNEKWADTITIDDMEATVFKSMLYFIYSDSLPNFVGCDDDSERQNMRLMAQHLLVAADRYQLERLRLMSDDLLCKNLGVSNVVNTLILAEQHNCSQLKAECLKFISSPEVFKAVVLTDDFHNLMKICPSILKDFY